MRVFRSPKYTIGRRLRHASRLEVALLTLCAIVLVCTPWQFLAYRAYTKATGHDDPKKPAAAKKRATPLTKLPNVTGDAVALEQTKSTRAYGIAAGGSLAGLSEAELNSELDQIAALGVTWIRFDVEWQNIQYKNATTYDWSDYDQVASAAAAHHLNMLGILAYTPPWARPAGCGDPKCAPANPATFATFAGAAAAHFKSVGLQAWEIWNEPNSAEFWAPRADAAAYTRLLRLADVSIKAANPKATVVTGGLSPQATSGANISPIDFLRGMYTAGAAGAFDDVGFHPYTFPLLPSSPGNHAWNQMANTSVSLRSLMAQNGDSAKKIWFTEFGAPTNGPGGTATATNYMTVRNTWHVDDSFQSQMADDAIHLYKTYDWAGPLFWYSFKDAGTSPDTNENFFGLVRADGSHKPAYDSFKQDIAGN